MSQRPLLKDNIVINVIEIDDDTLIMTKAEHKELMAQEDAEYEAKAAEWRATIGSVRASIDAEVDKLTNARATLSAYKITAEAEPSPAKAGAMLKQILAMERGIIEQEKVVAEVGKTKVPEKPRLIRAKRWFRPDDVVVGEPGGNIGDVWDGKQYTRPEKGAA